jgi:phosphosulfolactate synthase
MAPERKQEVIRRLASEFIVIAEVGSKGTQPVPGQWGAEMLGDMAAGAAWVVAEGRESGTIGLFEADGSVHRELVEEIVRAVGAETIIFEAPQRPQAVWLLRHLGPNVNLGNIAPEDVVALETLRRGLRYDTLEFLPTAAPAR